ncbi:MAG: hypothetical protein KA740_00810 [Rhodoferax sp.]|nr:hypothetical protein [Rhodoferax sp.]
MNTCDASGEKLAMSRAQLRQALRQTESAYPLHRVLKTAATTAELVLQPIAQAHPYRMVMGAALAGALLVRARPWRWLPASALLVSLLPQLVNAMSSQLKDKP